jgi:hypothetical protein
METRDMVNTLQRIVALLDQSKTKNENIRAALFIASEALDKLPAKPCPACHLWGKHSPDCVALTICGLD